MKGSITSTGNIQWRLFRRDATGNLRACVMVIEKDTSIVLTEKCEEDTPAPPEVAQTDSSGPLAHLTKFGIPHKIKAGADGHAVIEVYPHKAPVRTKRIMRFFDLTTPCDFPQCEELRRRWLEEKEALGENCTDCAASALQRRYMHQLGDILPP